MKCKVCMQVTCKHSKHNRVNDCLDKWEMDFKYCPYCGHNLQVLQI